MGDGESRTHKTYLVTSKTNWHGSCKRHPGSLKPDSWDDTEWRSNMNMPKLQFIYEVVEERSRRFMILS